MSKSKIFIFLKIVMISQSFQYYYNAHVLSNQLSRSLKFDCSLLSAKNAQNSLICPENFLTPNMELGHWTTLRAVQCALFPI